MSAAHNAGYAWRRDSPASRSLFDYAAAVSTDGGTQPSREDVDDRTTDLFECWYEVLNLSTDGFNVGFGNLVYIAVALYADAGNIELGAVKLERLRPMILPALTFSDST